MRNLLVGGATCAAAVTLALAACKGADEHGTPTST